MVKVVESKTGEEQGTNKESKGKIKEGNKEAKEAKGA